MLRIALIAPDARRAERMARLLSPIHGGLAPFTLEYFLASRRAGPAFVLDVGGGSTAHAIAFFERVRRRLLWPPPSARLGAAIAGLREPPAAIRGPRPRGTSASGLLLEGTVTPTRARRALRRTELSRDWIVEDPRRVRISDDELAELAREGVRWFALMPLELVAVVAGPALRRRLPRGRNGVPRGTPVWD